jgi:uncharacterized membrane protein YkoI
MPVSRPLAAALLLGTLAVPAVSADPCLTKTEQRAAVATHKAIPLAQAIKSLREHGQRAEVVRARLCRHGDDLVYMLTLLARSGKVTAESVDAASGEILNGR